MEVKAAVGDTASPQAIADIAWLFDLLEKSDTPLLRDLHNRIARVATWQASLKIRWFAVQELATEARQILHLRGGDTV